jgi:hypothetical protein
VGNGFRRKKSLGLWFIKVKFAIKTVKMEEVMENKYRTLTHDEKRAAEAAFRGAPFDPQLSESARKIYIGISSAMAHKRDEAFQEFDLSKRAKKAPRPSTASQIRSRAKFSLW